MFDPIALGLRAVAEGSPGAFPLCLAAGIVSSAGPCAAPRLLAITGLAGTGDVRRSRIEPIVTYACGMIAVYALFGASASLFVRSIDLSIPLYGAIAAVLIVCGVLTLWNGRNAHDHAPAAKHSPGGTFMLGASSAFVFSPCCTPLMAAIVTFGASSGRPAYAAAALAVFGLGHALPALLLGSFAARIARNVHALGHAQPLAIVTGALFLAMGGYYAVLA